MSKFLGKIRSPEVDHNAEKEYYFIGVGMGVTNVGQHKAKISDSKCTPKPSSNKVNSDH